MQSTNITDLFFWSNWWISQIDDVCQSRVHHINRSTWMRVAATSKLAAPSTSINSSFSFCFGLFNIMPQLAQSS